MFKLNHLHGFNKEHRPALLTLEHIAVAESAGSYSLTAMTGIEPGDFLVFYQVAGQADGPVEFAPDGFTVLEAVWGSGDYYITISAKIADGTEDGATILGSSPADNPLAEFSHVALRQFRGNAKVRGFTTAIDPGYSETSSNPGAQSTDASLGTLPLLVIVAAFSDSSIVSFSGTGITQQEVDGEFLHGFDIQNVGDTAVNRTVDTGDGGNANHLLIFYINLS